MSDVTTQTNANSSEDRQKRIEEQTSVGKYTMKQVKQEGVLILGAIAGYFAAKGLMKNAKVSQWVEGKVASLTESFRETPQAKTAQTNSIFSDIKRLSKWTAGMVGVVGGTFVSGIINAYEHWKNLESEKLAVSEINQDVGNLVNERAHFADTLNRQEAIIKELVAKGQDKGNFADRSAAASPTLPTL